MILAHWAEIKILYFDVCILCAIEIAAITDKNKTCNERARVKSRTSSVLSWQPLIYAKSACWQQQE